MYDFVFADNDGNGYIDENYRALGRLGESFVEINPDEMIPLPQGASLTMIPNRAAVVMNKKGQFTIYPHEGWVMGALLPQGYTRTLLPAFINDKKAPLLPLFGYAAVCAMDGEFYVAAVATDEDDHWNPKHFSTPELPHLVQKLRDKMPNNRLIEHLGHCALTYGCFTAQNIFYHRWEGGIPISPVCNANCLGCISLQPSECCPSPQERIKFKPTVEEVAELMNYHLGKEDAIISFGQGCEGEPSLQAETAAEAIRRVRAENKRGTINMNTNAGYTAGIKMLSEAGIDSIRVSLNSATDEVYRGYYRAGGYKLRDVKNSLKIAAQNGVYTYLNLLYYPGLNDKEGEIEALLDLVRECDVKAIQVRNLNIDPEMMTPLINTAEGEAYGTLAFLEILHEELPEVAIGNYTKAL